MYLCMFNMGAPSDPTRMMKTNDDPANLAARVTCHILYYALTPTNRLNALGADPFNETGD